MMEGIVEIFMKEVIQRIIKGAKLLGLLILKVLTSNKDSMEVFKEKYKGSVKPYLIGFGIFIGIIYLLIRMID